MVQSMKNLVLENVLNKVKKCILHFIKSILFDIYISKNSAMNDCSSIRSSLDAELRALRSSLESGDYSVDVGVMNELNYRLSDSGCGVLY